MSFLSLCRLLQNVLILKHYNCNEEFLVLMAGPDVSCDCYIFSFSYIVYLKIQAGKIFIEFGKFELGWNINVFVIFSS